LIAVLYNNQSGFSRQRKFILLLVFHSTRVLPSLLRSAVQFCMSMREPESRFCSIGLLYGLACRISLMADVYRRVFLSAHISVRMRECVPG